MYGTKLTAKIMVLSENRQYEMSPDLQSVDLTVIVEAVISPTTQELPHTRILCGYEAGCLGYSLYRQLTYHNVNCVILAPSTMGKFDNLIHKNDYRDARTIPKCLAFNTYKAVHAPTEIDEAVKDYTRMRDEANAALKAVEQQIIAYSTRHGFLFDGKSKWSKRHPDWLQPKPETRICEGLWSNRHTAIPEVKLVTNPKRLLLDKQVILPK